MGYVGKHRDDYRGYAPSRGSVYNTKAMTVIAEDETAQCDADGNLCRGDRYQTQRSEKRWFS